MSSQLMNTAFISLLGVWVVLVLVVFSRDGKVINSETLSVATTTRGVSPDLADEGSRVSRRLSSSSSSVQAHPFLSNQCYDVIHYLQNDYHQKFKHSEAYLILPVHNPEPNLLIESVSNHFSSMYMSVLSLQTIRTVIILHCINHFFCLNFK